MKQYHDNSMAKNIFKVVDPKERENILSKKIPKQLIFENIIPLRPKSKMPALKWEKYQNKPYENLRRLKYWQGNFGVITGDLLHPGKHLIVLDLDDKDLYAGFEDVETFTVETGSRGYHLYFYSKKWDGRNTLKVPGFEVDIKGGRGGYVVIPPSKHPDTGREYKVVKDLPILEIEDVIAFVEDRLGVKIRKEEKQHGEATGQKTTSEAIKPLLEALKPYWKGGHRNNLSLGVTGIMKKAGMDFEEAKSIFETYLKEVGDEELQARLRTLIETYEKNNGDIGGVKTLIDELRVMKVGDNVIDHINQLSAKILNFSNPVHFERYGDEWDQILERIAKNPDVHEIVNILASNPYKNKIDTGMLVRALYKAIKGEMDFIIEKRGDDNELKYLDPRTGLIAGPGEEAVTIIIGRLLSHLGYSNSNLKNHLLLALEGNVPSYHRIPADKLSPRGLCPLEDGFINHKTLEFFDYQEGVDNGVFFHDRLPWKHRDDFVELIKSGNFRLEIFAPKFHKFLTRFFDDHNRQLLELTLGWVFAPEQTKRPLAFVVGPPDSGKSTLKEIIMKVLGDRRAITSGLDELQGRFGLSNIPGAWVVLDSEMPSELIDIEKVKRLTGGETVLIEEKYKKPYQTLIRALFMFFMNDLPRFSNIDKALCGRIILIETQNPLVEGEKDPMFVDRLIEEEGEAIFYWLLSCYHKLRKAGFIIEKDEELIEALLTRAKTNVIAFKEDVIVEDPNAEIKGTDLYDSYLKWCGENGDEAFGRNNFYQQITVYTNAVRVKKDNRLYFERIRVSEEKRAEKDEDKKENNDKIKGEYQQAILTGDYEKFDDLQKEVLKEAIEDKKRRETSNEHNDDHDDDMFPEKQTIRYYDDLKKAYSKFEEDPKPPRLRNLAEALSLIVGITIKEAENVILDLVEFGKVEMKDGRVLLRD